MPAMGENTYEKSKIGSKPSEFLKDLTNPNFYLSWSCHTDPHQHFTFN